MTTQSTASAPAATPDRGRHHFQEQLDMIYDQEAKRIED